MVAVAITALTTINEGKTDLVQDDRLKINPKKGSLSQAELAEKRQQINKAIRGLKDYGVPSSVWFAYQGSLQAVCNQPSIIQQPACISPNSLPDSR